MSYMDLFDGDDSSDEKSFKPFPVRNYQVAIEEAILDEKPPFGPQIKYKLRVTEESEFKKRVIFVNRKIQENTMFKIRMDFSSLGLGKVNSTNFNSSLEKIIGKIVNISLGYSPNKNNPSKPWQQIEFLHSELDQVVNPGVDEIPF